VRPLSARTRRLLLAPALALAFAALAAPASAQAPLPLPVLPPGDVVEIVIEGTRRVEVGAVRNAIGTEVGRPVTRAQIRSDILAIRRLQIGRTPYFDDVVVDVSPTEGGVIVTYRLREKPVIARLDYEFLGDDDLRGDIGNVVDLQVGDIFDLARVRSNIRKIEELYREEGYYLAEAGFTWSVLDDGDIDLRIQITEYEEVEVRRVTFVGNEALSDEQLQGVMATRPGQLLGFLTGAGVFNEAEFANDRTRLRLFYYDNGYVDVDVGDPQVELSRDLAEVYITIPIVEGPQYRVSDVAVRGDLLAPADEIQARFVRTTPGDTFSSTAIRQDIDRISTFYKDQGYATVNVNLGTRRDAAAQTLALSYDIQQGELVYIGRIHIRGNSTTRDEVIRRELRILESDLYSGTAIRVSRARVERLGFFERVEIREVARERAGLVDLEIEVSERPTGQFQVGAGFSSVESFIATATVAQNNLFGRGQSLQLQASLSALRTIFSLGFQEPYFFGTRWQFGFEVFNREILFTDFTRTSTGFSFTLGHPITDDVIASGTYQFETVAVEPGGRSGRRDRRFANLFTGGITSSVRGTILWDTRNNRLFPSRGFLQRVSVELADAIFGSENEFVRISLNSRWYYELLSVIVVKFNAELGWVATTDPARPVPIFERFFLGGPNTVRGFERATLSPREPVASDPNDPSSFLVGFPVGGNKELFFNLELEFPILTAIGVRGVLFADAGNAFAENRGFTLDLDILHPGRRSFDDLLRTAMGFGFRWLSPIGPLRFEWGFPLEPLPGEDSSVFEFSIGNFL
jgi:outer membrane protein insertion porin family